jgi:hypothetical protein
MLLLTSMPTFMFAQGQIFIVLIDPNQLAGLFDGP